MTQDNRRERTQAAERILNVAEELFAARGYDGVSMRDVAQAAEVSKANVFHHYASKWELYCAVVEGSAEELNELLRHLNPQTGDTEHSLASFTGEHLVCMLEKSAATKLFLRQMIAPRDEQERELTGNVIGERLPMVVNSLRELQSAGRLRSDADLDVLAIVLLGSSLSFLLLQDVPGDKKADVLKDPMEYSRRILRLLTQGILPNSER